MLRKYRDISPHSRHTHIQPILAAAFVHAASPATRKRSLAVVWNSRGESIVWFQVHGPDGNEPFPSARQQLRLHATQALQALNVRTYSDLHAFRDRIAQRPSVSELGRNIDMHPGPYRILLSQLQEMLCTLSTHSGLRATSCKGGNALHETRL